MTGKIWPIYSAQQLTCLQPCVVAEILHCTKHQVGSNSTCSYVNTPIINNGPNQSQILPCIENLVWYFSIENNGLVKGDIVNNWQGFQAVDVIWEMETLFIESTTQTKPKIFYNKKTFSSCYKQECQLIGSYLSIFWFIFISFASILAILGLFCIIWSQWFLFL